jgi:AcrR family transcriptional regulator
MSETTIPTRERILAAALDIAGREGLRALTTRRVAAHAGITLGLVHYHFGSKAVLAAETLDAFMDELRSNITASGNAISRNETGSGEEAGEDEAIARVFEGILDAAMRRPGLIAGLFVAAAAIPEGSGSFIRAFPDFDRASGEPPLFAFYRPLASRMKELVTRRCGPGNEALAGERSLRLLSSILHPLHLTKLPGALFGVDFRSPERRAAYIRAAVADALKRPV